MRFNNGFKFRQHLDNHFTEHLVVASENSKRAPYLSHSEFQQSKKAVLRDAEVIPYNEESTLCVVCRQRIELEQVGDDFVFKEGKHVQIDGQSSIAH